MPIKVNLCLLWQNKRINSFNYYSHKNKNLYVKQFNLVYIILYCKQYKY